MHNNGMDYVHYRDPANHTNNYMIVIDDVIEFNKWKAGDTSITPVTFASTSMIFHSEQGDQGVWGEAKGALLESTFGRKDHSVIAEIILTKGDHKPGKVRQDAGSTNNSR